MPYVQTVRFNFAKCYCEESDGGIITCGYCLDYCDTIQSQDSDTHIEEQVP